MSKRRCRFRCRFNIIVTLLICYVFVTACLIQIYMVTWTSISHMVTYELVQVMTCCLTAPGDPITRTNADFWLVTFSSKCSRYQSLDSVCIWHIKATTARGQFGKIPQSCIELNVMRVCNKVFSSSVFQFLRLDTGRFRFAHMMGMVGLRRAREVMVRSRDFGGKFLKIR